MERGSREDRCSPRAHPPRSDPLTVPPPTTVRRTADRSEKEVSATRAVAAPVAGEGRWRPMIADGEWPMTSPRAVWIAVGAIEHRAFSPVDHLVAVVGCIFLAAIMVLAHSVIRRVRHIPDPTVSDVRPRSARGAPWFCGGTSPSGRTTPHRVDRGTVVRRRPEPAPRLKEPRGPEGPRGSHASGLRPLNVRRIARRLTLPR
jgi:hypothetical protein